MVKRTREPNEADKKTNKRRRGEEKTQQLDPASQQHLQTRNEEDLGRPRPSQQPEQGGIPGLPQMRPDHPNVQQASEQPEQEHRPLAIPQRPEDILASSHSEPSDWQSSISETSTCYSQDAKCYNIGSDVAAVGTPQAKDVEYWGSEEAAKFIRSGSGLEAKWVGIRPLGEGDNGIAGLWELRGDDGRTIEQMVVKEESKKMKDWNEYEVARGVPREVKVMSELNKANCHAIPRLFKYKRYPHVYKHRIYMEFCPYKDLEVLCSRYSRFKQFLPEEFLWETFYHLVEAAVAMKSGTGDWDFEIIHRDLKPVNIFLGKDLRRKTTGNGHPIYPVAKLGDFGWAVMTNHQDRSNPSDYRDRHGTVGYLAPEQATKGHPVAYTDPLSSYTNIWAIGVTMFELLTLYRHEDHMLDDQFNDQGMIYPIKTDRQPDYSIDLTTLVSECVEPNPLKRIKIRALRSRIKSARRSSRKKYKESSDEGKERIRASERLYFVGNEINKMPTGTWRPNRKLKSPSRPESGQFPDRDFPIVFPRFDDGPEVEEKQRKDPTPPSEGHRKSNPIILSDNLNAHNDNIGDLQKRSPAARDLQDLSDARRPADRILEDDGRLGVRRDDDDDDGGDEEASVNMELGTPPSTPLAAPAPAPAPAPTPVPAPGPQAAPQIQNQTQAAPQTQTQTQAQAPIRLPKTLRNGRVYAYY